MMDKVLRISAAMKRGLPIYCSTCKKYWEGRAKGLPGDQCTASLCGSPIARMDFPEYEGPIVDHGRWCFVCGVASTHAVRLPTSERVFGMCVDHLPMLVELVAQRDNWAKPPMEGPLEILTPGGGATEVVKLLHKKPGLMAAIAEAEAFLDEEDRKKFGE